MVSLFDFVFVSFPPLSRFFVLLLFVFVCFFVLFVCPFVCVFVCLFLSAFVCLFEALDYVLRKLVPFDVLETWDLLFGGLFVLLVCFVCLFDVNDIIN